MKIKFRAQKQASLNLKISSPNDTVTEAKKKLSAYINLFRFLFANPFDCNQILSWRIRNCLKSVETSFLQSTNIRSSYTVLLKITRLNKETSHKQEKSPISYHLESDYRFLRRLNIN